MRKLSAIAAIAVSAFAPSAYAAISLVNYDGFVVVQSGNTWNFHHESPENTALKGGTVYGRSGATVSTSQPLTVSTRGTLPVAKGAVVDVVAKIPRSNMAKGLVALAKIGRVTPGGLLAGIAVNALVDYGLKNVKLGPDGSLTADGEQEDAAFVSDGRVWQYGDKPFNSKEQACAYGLSTIGPAWIVVNLKMTNIYSDVVACDYTLKIGEGYDNFTRNINIFSPSYSNCLPGYYVWNNSCTKDKPTKAMQENEIIDKLSQESGWPTSSAIALQEMLSYPDTRKILTPYPDNGVTLIGDPSVQGKTSTNTESVQLLPGTNTVAPPGTANTDPGTRTTTTTSTHPLAYSGNKVTYSTVNNTTTNITNNTTNVTTTESKTEKVEDDSEEQTPSDAPLPDLPKLYEKKYPDGLSGVWDTRIQEIKSSGLFALAGQLMPTSLNSGTCPSFNIDLSIGTWADYGTHEVPIPCSIWDTCKYILLVLTVASARRLVFGG